MLNINKMLVNAIGDVLDDGIETEGRTENQRIRLLGGKTFHVAGSADIMQVLTLRKNSPYLAFAETYAFLCGASTVDELMEFHPGLKLWSAWADDNGDLGGVYGEAFSEQYLGVISRLKKDPLSTHVRMTTLIPEKFPIPGNTYHENVAAGKFSLMPCLHSFHFLSDGKSLHLHATQASGDLLIGVIPHNLYQSQFLLALTAKLTGLKVGDVHHNVHDLHIYTNQLEQATELEKRYASNTEEIYTPYSFLDGYGDFETKSIKDIIQVADFKSDQPLSIPVDS